MSLPAVALEPPPSWSVGQVERVPLSEGSGAAFTQWKAWRAMDRDGALVTACVATPIPGWIEDLRPAVTARGRGVLFAVAEKLAHRSVVQGDDGDPFPLNDPATGRTVGHARAFLGFASGSHAEEARRVFTCFAACTDDEGGATCAPSVASARLVGSGSPPAPGLALAAASAATRHPRPIALAVLMLAIVGGFVAIVARPRPRARI